MTEKIGYLDGLRGVAAINVMLMHFFIVLLPAMIYSDRMPSHLGNLEKIFTSTPLGLIGAGNFSVCIFFVLSGYVLTQKYFKTKDRSIIISGAVRRYIRLFVPVFAATMLSFLLASTEMYHYFIEAVMISGNNNYANYWTFTPDLAEAIKQAAWGTFFAGDDTYNPVLWTMSVEFYGSMLVFAMALFFGSLRARWTFYLAAVVLFLNTYYLAFIIGMGLADVFNGKTSIFKTSNKVILSIVLASGLFLGSYPVGTVTADSLYAFLDNGFFQTPKYAYHILGAGMLMYVLLNSQRMQKIFSSPVLVFLGKISYSLYLVHFLVISTLTCALFLVLHPVLPYGAAVLISCVLSVLVIIPLSYLFYRYVDMRGIKLSKVFYNQLASIFRPISAGNITQNYLSNAIFTIYNKLFK
ncbi:Peptidoglycan/LPS O-acetylase OafA/YrhL, contains acyltransferase and SGNH-hydrolase domains [Methanosarcina thermophila]|jgi:peptidoglycan/LPS O-acetylase OafA/YrhL|uniref:Peptidoglycan/LPS O-acetylase OafA/YrhL, contains acyltransferase and SGNH-hydrolase domains n=3 Tax=Methanosarcina thermophila TaxID=2210 RepID=A0A1I7BCY3_METTE|nr:acyltransferase [Methanosarcina thermophila]ALK05905.1 MAG: acyltransferase [Methanosarcina sp. 795]AKB12571.1 acyltransferase, putative [Methanosarcina thermophila TM-1]AKB16774.1 acyltransferase, putative [Methanosarcina thermophila CHTI-55]NLU58154.1 acyltransferase [Methanosarcina thermophila]SFT85056.1 Peptidoglycan/LPS O-acetylase OafA/YrhL, contains acyltransferase and SGNH-hydrolase domains [Methanosarcina thermophila]